MELLCRYTHPVILPHLSDHGLLSLPIQQTLSHLLLLPCLLHSPNFQHNLLSEGLWYYRHIFTSWDHPLRVRVLIWIQTFSSAEMSILKFFFHQKYAPTSQGDLSLSGASAGLTHRAEIQKDEMELEYRLWWRRGTEASTGTDKCVFSSRTDQKGKAVYWNKI